MEELETQLEDLFLVCMYVYILFFWERSVYAHYTNALRMCYVHVLTQCVWIMYKY